MGVGHRKDGVLFTHFSWTFVLLGNGLGLLDQCNKPIPDDMKPDGRCHAVVYANPC